MPKAMYVYIMSNTNDTTLYTGVTNDLARRAYEHRHQLVPGFTKRYNITKLLYYEVHDSPETAIEREKQIKAGSRKKKEMLIERVNPLWNDLYDGVVDESP